ncbi:secreted RxLR effector protein 161-like [Benincasa hispida]|uniref:secreted RxLR effector protein 161-like n=1 Tax=Benincasa hispida TaxID=102211 RepID=UPI00190255FA|nr:secreted RxLR effector protein 161-like [Benincasa hispida]
MAEFETTDLGLMHYFLSIEVIQSVARIFINQKKYAPEILDRFQMENCNLATTPVEPNLKLTKDHEGNKVNSTLYKQMVGSLMYLIATRPDIMYVVSLISKFMESPIELHLLAAKRILCYLKGTPGLGILYQKREKLNIVGFSNSDYARDLNDGKSTSGYVFMLGSKAISWFSKKQPIFTLSTNEAELVVATSCACQAIWLRNILENCIIGKKKHLSFIVITHQ